MFGLRRFRFRSPERDRDTVEWRLVLIQSVLRSAIAEAEPNPKDFEPALRGREDQCVSPREVEIASPTRLAAPSSRILNALLSLANKASRSLEDHLTALRKLERRPYRLVDQPRVSSLRPL
jgi:hypothetical protein